MLRVKMTGFWISWIKENMSLKINFTCFLFLFFSNMAPRTFKITHVAGGYDLHYVSVV